jgi:hypothetical protein
MLINNLVFLTGQARCKGHKMEEEKMSFFSRKKEKKEKKEDGLWTVMLGEFIATLAILEKAGLTPDMLRQIREKNGEEKAKEIVAIFLKEHAISDFSEVIKKEWQKIYKKYFGKVVDFSEVIIPASYDPKKHFGIIVAKGTTMNEVVKGMRKFFTVSLYAEDLDKSVTKNDRIADKDYFIMFNKNVEADEKLKNLSADQLAEKKILGITLLERLLMECYYFEKSKKHLDINNWTLCSGSRDAGGDVPSVDWDPDCGDLNVIWCSSGIADAYLRSREVVSC